MAKRDYYEVLGVARDADEATLKKAYRRLAMTHHPDRNPEDARAEAAFKEAKEAWEVLSDARRRAAYDRYGHAGVDASAGGGGGFEGADIGDIFESVFGDIFGGGRSGGRSARGPDLRYDLELTLEEAVRGVTRTLEVPTLQACEPCGGSGAKPGTEPVTCATCGGHGQVRIAQGFFSVQQTCPRCRGSGRMIRDACSACAGAGRVRTLRNLEVRIPAGVDTGDRVRLAGEGEAGPRGAMAGDLYVVIQVVEHPIFRRDGSDLHSEVPIGFSTAALGGELEVPTLDGRAILKIPAGTQSGALFRLRGKGVTSVHGGGTGDLIVRVLIETPVNLSSEQRELLRRFEESLHSGEDTAQQPRATSWLDGVKKFFEENFG